MTTHPTDKQAALDKWVSDNTHELDRYTRAVPSDDQRRCFIAGYEAALTAQPVTDDGWRPISEITPEQAEAGCWLASWIIPSEEARRNGSRAHWDIGHGRRWTTINGDRYTGILGGKPEYFIPAPFPYAPSGNKYKKDKE